MPHIPGDKGGFTLTEMLVVVAIIILLVSIVVPNLAGRITEARMHAAEDQIAEIEAALAAYHADFGTYPGDVFPTEDLDNDGVLTNEDANNNGVLDAGEDLNNNGALDDEDIGVDVDRDGSPDYAIEAGVPAVGNGRLDQGDGVVNILDLEWALKTRAKNGPYMEEIPLDPWGNKYVYWAPLVRPTYNPNDPGDQGDLNYLYFDPADLDTPADAGLGLPARTLCTEDKNGNGRLDDGEDIGIADYDVDDTNPAVNVVAGFVNMRAGAGNAILDHGDDDNKNNSIERYVARPGPPYLPAVHHELGNKDISPDGLARNIGYYIYSFGRNQRDETATGYEDINLNWALNDTSNPISIDPDPSTFDEDIDGDGSLDTGYEDTGLDGNPGTKDTGEGDGILTIGTGGDTRDEEFTGPYNNLDPDDLLDRGGDDTNSWNKKRPWREHPSYGG
ncbi:MAG: type II secretion system protein GspG [Candidatus Hydrogenedentota bacterium]|nr:MAG: type II secretion system protein GspG [Candidatus Hydrogenedentota bacterium]